MGCSPSQEGSKLRHFCSPERASRPGTGSESSTQWSRDAARSRSNVRWRGVSLNLSSPGALALARPPAGPAPRLWRGAGLRMVPAGPQVKSARVRLRQSLRSCLHTRGPLTDPRPNSSCEWRSHRPARPSHPLLPRHPSPAPYVMETRTSEILSQSQAAAGGKERAGGGGGSGEPRLSGKEEREGRGEPRVPRPSLRTPFPDPAASSNRRSRARQPGTRSPGPPLKRPLHGARVLVPVPAALPPRARALARPQAPRGLRHVTAPSQGGSSGGASFGGGGGSGSGSSCAASVEREACGCGKKGAPDRNGWAFTSLCLPGQSCWPPGANGPPAQKLCASPSCSAVRPRVAAAPPGVDRAAVLTKGAAPRPPCCCGRRREAGGAARAERGAPCVRLCGAEEAGPAGTRAATRRLPGSGRGPGWAPPPPPPPPRSAAWVGSPGWWTPSLWAPRSPHPRGVAAPPRGAPSPASRLRTSRGPSPHSPCFPLPPTAPSHPRPSRSLPYLPPLGKWFLLPGEVSGGCRPPAAVVAGQVTCGGGRAERWGLGVAAGVLTAGRSADCGAVSRSWRGRSGRPSQVVSCRARPGRSERWAGSSACASAPGPARSPRPEPEGRGSVGLRVYTRCSSASSRVGRAIAHPAAGRPRPGVWWPWGQRCPALFPRAPGGSPSNPRLRPYWPFAGWGRGPLVGPSLGLFDWCVVTLDGDSAGVREPPRFSPGVSCLAPPECSRLLPIQIFGLSWKGKNKKKTKQKTRASSTPSLERVSRRNRIIVAGAGGVLPYPILLENLVVS